MQPGAIRNLLTSQVRQGRPADPFLLANGFFEMSHGTTIRRQHFVKLQKLYNRIYFVFLFSPLPQIAAYFCYNRPIYYRKDKNNDEENRGYNRVF